MRIRHELLHFEEAGPMSRAVQYDEFGGPEVLHLVDVGDVGEPATGEARIRVVVAGLNPVDTKLRSGFIPQPGAVFPSGTCTDVAGIVEAVADGEAYVDGTAVAVGDEVFGWAPQQALREQSIVAVTQLTRKPAGLDWNVAGSLMTAGLTADAAITTLGIHDGDTVLLSAAAGGVGVVFAQLAIARGATVIGTASAANHDFLREFGVIPVEYGPGLVDRVRAIAPQGISAVQDNQGRETITAGFELGVAPERICTIADHAAVAELGIASPGRYTRSISILAALGAEVAAGRIRVPIDAEFGFEQFREAFEALDTHHARGKIVVRVSAP
jgi:NADPH:quinone reductase-like Zn-dependent oxidoreductase